MSRSLAVFILLIAFWTPNAWAQPPERVNLGTDTGQAQGALYFPANGDYAAVLVHQSGADAESWHGLASEMTANGIAALALDRSHPADVKAGLEFLFSKGWHHITLVGASMGGGAVLQALDKSDDGRVDTVVLLAPATGPALVRTDIEKLIVVAKFDFFGKRARTAFAEAAEPKVLAEYEGRDHGQDLLTGVHGAAVRQRVLDFILHVAK
jgi:alpha-beta hydrolase superfamily lysophospholipase